MGKRIPKTEILWTGRFIRLVRQGHWEFVERVNLRGIVAIAALDGHGHILLVEQYRIPVRARVIELPAGLVGDTAVHRGESLLTAARRELLEETGYRARRWRRICEGPPSCGVISEHVTFFLAEELSRTHDGGGDTTEDIVVHHVPLSGADAWLRARERRGVRVDPKVFTGLYFAERAARGRREKNHEKRPGKKGI